VEHRENLVWHQGSICSLDRQRLLGQKALTVWLTGLSGSGKSTLAAGLDHQLTGAGYACYVLDGDNIRHGLNRDLGFSPADRRENIRRIAEVARLMNDAGLIAITAFISPYRDDRQMAKEIIGPDSFLEVYLNTSLAVCEERDPKGFYKRAREGQLKDFTGINAPYEAPVHPEILVDTGAYGIEDCISQLAKIVVNSASL
jgi:adenylyl-sulfate kinase